MNHQQSRSSPLLHSREAVSQLVALAQVELEQSGLEHVIEHSDRSEAVYLHTKRQGYWYGVRIASHHAAYACSLDYHQVILHGSQHADQLERAAQQLLAAVLRGGAIVADPQEVQALIESIRLREADGYATTDSEGMTWRWNGRTRQWQAETSSDETMAAPSFQPRAPISHLECSSLRHRLNVIAKWSFDEFRNLSAD